MSRVGLYPSTMTAYATAYKRLYKAGVELPDLRRKYTCSGCGEVHESAARRGPVPKRCRECFQRDERKRLKECGR